MPSIFVNIEAQVANSSDEDPDSSEELEDLINDEDDVAEGSAPARSPLAALASRIKTGDSFLDDLERRYAEDAPRSVLGKRKAPDIRDGDDIHPVIPIMARQMATPPPDFHVTEDHLAAVPIRPHVGTISGTMKSSREVHPLTKKVLPRREQAVQLSDKRRLLHRDPTLVGLSGEWLQGMPPATTTHGRAQLPSATKKRKEVRQWSKWAELQSRTDGIAPGEWVRIRRGTYKGDIGQIWKAQTREKTPEEQELQLQEINEAQRQNRSPPKLPEFIFEGYWVLLVPRLPPSYLTEESSLRLRRPLERRQRFGQALFVPAEYDIQLPEEHPMLQGFEIDGHLLSHSLLLKLYKVESLELVPVISPQTYKSFLHHPHCKHFPFPIPELWHLHDGDEVEVSVGGDKSLVRGVLKVSEDGCLLLDQGEAGLHPVSSIEHVSKVVNIGDYVTIARGAHEGGEGLVVEKHGSILGVSEKGSRKGIDFFVHVNSVVRDNQASYHHSSIPWLDKEVTIVKGRYGGRHGIVKDVKRKPNRATLFLWLFLPQLQITFEVQDDQVFAKGTHQPLWEVFPLTRDQRHFDIQCVGDMRTGEVPWVGTYVVIVGGPHKGKEGIVKDVNRTTTKRAVSGLMTTVELNVAGSAWEKIYYDYVREHQTGLTLATYQPLLENQDFYKPNPRFVGAGVVWKRSRSSFVSLRTLWSSKHAADRDIMGPTPDDPNALPMDVWNPYYDDFVGWSYPRTEEPASPAPSPLRPSSSAVTLTKPSTHWLSRSELVGLSIMVDITAGTHKKKDVFVEPTRMPTGTIVARIRKGKSKTSYDIPFELIAMSGKKLDARDDPLLVVITSEHVGKLVRRIQHFYCGSESVENKWFILAVFDRENVVECLTGEIIECATAELQYVEEAPADRFRATHVVMKRVRDEARLNLPPVVRNPGTADLSVLQACLNARISSRSQL
ncbi:hypothetical protein V5O48_013462 [Marasmius crinis-equi]|uniref:KOW domain-containing protein n=1 Tax=Marasmius crinis-equi TaxID=585013 RepID=A0ABR3F011_9AGAR